MAHGLLVRIVIRCGSALSVSWEDDLACSLAFTLAVWRWGSVAGVAVFVHRFTVQSAVAGGFQGFVTEGGRGQDIEVV